MRTFAFVAKPTAAAAVAPVTRALRAAGADVTVEYSRGLDDARRLARDAAGNGRTVVAAGGDGMVGAVAGSVSEEDGVLGVIPAGRGNDFARQLGLLVPPARAAAILLDGRERCVDLIETAGRVVGGHVHAGADSLALAYAERSWIPGIAAYTAGAVRAILSWGRPVSYRVRVDGEDYEQFAFTVVVANTEYYGGGYHIAPSAVPDDGLLDVIIIRHMPRRRVISVLREIRRGDHIHRPEVVVVRGRQVTIEADRDLPVSGDGEFIGRLPTTITVRPGALNVLCS